MGDKGKVVAKTVICAKWGEKFPADEVNRLHRMVRRWISGPLRFVCFTDNPKGLAEQINWRAQYRMPDVARMMVESENKSHDLLCATIS